MGSRAYQSKRNFARTSEPRGKTQRRAAFSFEAQTPVGARKAAHIDFVAPQLATLVDKAPEGPEWLHEIKLDGYRVLACCDRDAVTLFTRKGNDWTRKLPSLAAALRALSKARVMLDGELVVMQDGRSDFQRLQNSLSEGRDASCVYFVFDLLHLGDHDLRRVTLRERKRLLRELLETSGVERTAVRYNDHSEGQGAAFFEQACTLGVEGSVAKRADAPYTSGRGRSWLKVKCTKRQEFVIGGFTEPEGARAHLGALLLGVNAGGTLRYAGRVGTGFTARSLAELYPKLHALEQPRPAFAEPPTGAQARGVHWVAPKLVAEIDFGERTRDGIVRHASFQGLREDKPAREVRDEAPARMTAKGPAKRTEKPRAKPHAKAGPSRGADSSKTQRSSGHDVQLPLPALRSVHLTHPDRVMYAAQGLTKADLALYYAQVAELMLPHVAERPLTLVRCPAGSEKECWFQKHPSQGIARAIHRVPITEKAGQREYMWIDDAEGLLALVQLGALEIHTWGSRADRVEQPDQLVFDLDPDEGLPWPRMIEAAQLLRAQLAALELQSFLKVTGGKGLHVVVPIAPAAEWDEVKTFCKAFVDTLAKGEPERYVTNISKAKRRGKILLDYLRNGRGATAIAPYSTRAKPHATVAVPIAWEELTPALRPEQLDVHAVSLRIAALKRDPWKGFFERPGKLPRAAKARR